MGAILVAQEVKATCLMYLITVSMSENQGLMYIEKTVHTIYGHACKVIEYMCGQYIGGTMLKCLCQGLSSRYKASYWYQPVAILVQGWFSISSVGTPPVSRIKLVWFGMLHTIRFGMV